MFLLKSSSQSFEIEGTEIDNKFNYKKVAFGEIDISEANMKIFCL